MTRLLTKQDIWRHNATDDTFHDIKNLDLSEKISNNPKIHFLDDLYYSSGVDIFRTVRLHASKNKVFHVVLISCYIKYKLF